MSSFSESQIIYRVFRTIVLCFFGWVFLDRIIICDMFFFGISFFQATKCYAYVFFGMQGFSDRSWGCGMDMLCFKNTVCFFGSAICFLGGTICFFCDNICFFRSAAFVFGIQPVLQICLFSKCTGSQTKANSKWASSKYPPTSGNHATRVIPILAPNHVNRLPSLPHPSILLIHCAHHVYVIFFL